ncbi:MAG: outer membrane lipoprotein-sorting protein [Gammaproteobacteria bacterium]
MFEIRPPGPRRARRGHLALLGLLVAVRAAAFDTSRIADAEVRACAERALPSDTMTQLQAVEVVDKHGFVRESRRSVQWKRDIAGESRVLVRVLEPPDERGLAVLISDDGRSDVVSFMTYSPKIKRVRRVSGDSFFGSVLGTDFTYEDFQYFYRVDEREQVDRVADDVIEGHPVYVLETVKPDDNSHYRLVRFSIDQRLCLPMRTDFIAPNGELRKQLVVAREEVREVDGKWVPFRTTMFDHKHETHTVFLVEEVEIDPELDASLFEVGELRRGN